MDDNTRKFAVACMLTIIVLTGLGTAATLLSPIDPPDDDDKDTNTATTNTTTTTPIVTLPPGVQSSQFKFTLYGEDTASAVSGMTVTAWYDANNDDKMQSGELRLCSDSSGVYTSGREYPIGAEYDIWLEYYGANYQTGYAKVHMSGAAASDLSAKIIDEQVFIRATDDSVIYDGTINGVTWDDSTNYNYTTSGATGLAEIRTVLSAADKGLSSRIWESVNYRSIYADLFTAGNLDITDYSEGFWIKWDTIVSDTIATSQILAPDFFGIYMTIQDKIDLSPSTSNFAFSGDDNTNWYGAIIVSSAMGDLMYNTADTSAPRPLVSFNVGTMTAAGQTVATYGVGIHTGLTYEQMVEYIWTASATYMLGTGGNDWDWEP